MSTTQQVSPTAYIVPGLRQSVHVPVVECDHVRFSTDMIREAARQAKGGDAIILGAGLCHEIPLIDLSERFTTVAINDVDEPLLDVAMERSGRPANVEKRVADLTGITSEFLAQVDDVLKNCLSETPEAVAGQLASLAESFSPLPFTTDRRYDLVIASCVLCQLHLGVWNGSVARFQACFPGKETVLLQSPSWATAMYGLARRMEDRFIDSLCGLVAPDGRIYLSETVQCAMLLDDPERSGWLSEGFLRMTRTPELFDYLDGRFHIEKAGRWLWVMPPSEQEGGVGRLFRVQGFQLSLVNREPKMHQA